MNMKRVGPPSLSGPHAGVPDGQVDAVLDQLDDLAPGPGRQRRAGPPVGHEQCLGAELAGHQPVQRPDAFRPIPTTAPTAASLPLCFSKAGGYDIPPFIGPMTTAAPTPCIRDGSLGETGIG